jgi:hypothetical protein
MGLLLILLLVLELQSALGGRRRRTIDGCVLLLSSEVIQMLNQARLDFERLALTLQTRLAP